MTTTTEPSGRRAGATWVAATGAFLLLAGAAVFVAVRWDRLSGTTKLGLVAALTAAFLAGGHALRPALPATGDVFFHLGAFLLPVDLAALGLRTGIGWRALLLAEGVLGVVALGGLAALTGSVVLEWAGAASMAVLAAGIASLSPVPAPLVLVGVAVAAELSGRRRLQGLAWVWAAVAGLAPAVGAGAALVLGIGHGTLRDLGVSGSALGASVSGVAAALVLARQAKRSDDLRLAVLALASLLTGLVSGWAAAALPAGAGGTGLAGLFLAVEVAALVGGRDPFWTRPLSSLAEAAEVPATVAAGLAGVLLLFAPFATHLSPDPVRASSFGLLAVGFLVADARRYAGTPRPFALRLLRGGAWAPGTVLLAAAAAVAVEVGTASTLATAGALLVLAVLAMASERPWSELVVAGFGAWAVVTAGAHPSLAAATGLAGAGLVAETAVRGARRNGASPTEPLLAGAAVATALLGIGIAAPTVGVALATAAAVPACWLLALQLDRAPGRVGDVARAALVLPVVYALSLSPLHALPVVAAATALLAADAVRLGRREPGAAAAVVLQAVVAELALAAGLSGPAVGVALSIAAVAWAGLAVVVDGDWRLPFVVAAGTGLGLGLLVSSPDPATFANCLLVAGGLGVAAGVTARRSDVGQAGGALCTIALAIHLATVGVQATEPYVAPVAAQLLVAGWVARRRHPGQTTSWAAYVPAIALLGGAGLLERLAGGAGWHALVAGSVGLAAVAAGGWRRLAGPMLVGTGLLVALTVHESLGALAGVPTWAWLSTGGTVLLGIGVALERSDTSPVEAGRRLVDVVGERFG
ncbi:MAG TPA: hypothetical protein VHT97_11940 [Acidimicrobiales bacterium]|nr:hypothetical protein [Acidimicrobiales bacterium]